MFTWSEDVRSLPGPVGVKYDDSMTVLKIHLVVMGIKAKTMVRAANTDVHLKYNEEGLCVLLEVFKLNKKTKPPMKTILEKRFFEMRKCPRTLDRANRMRSRIASSRDDMSVKMLEDICSFFFLLLKKFRFNQ
uniref:Retrovirus-related Pol polyprotein from transposon TNT 1-94 n=1 Tax=Loa loa TaxID=7209 RepID=A0A1I7VK24_LOALO